MGDEKRANDSGEVAASVGAELPAPQALHHRIRADIEGRILSGVWPPGHRIPFEHELMAEYGCARMTVNKVLSGLVEAGLIERRRRAGSFVRRPVEQSAVLEIPDIKAQILAAGDSYRYELLSSACRAASREEQLLFGLAAKTRLRALECRHHAGKLPFALEQRRIFLAAIPAAEQADFSTQSPGGWLLGHVPWQEAEHRIHAMNADVELAEKLGMTAGQACLVIDRRTWHGGALLTAVRIWYPGDRHALIARFTPAGPGRS